MASDNVASSGSSPPTFFFDLENCRHLPHELFLNYMKVCQILCFDKLREDFTGATSQLRRLMYEVTVYDFFVVTEALTRDASILTECTYRDETYPKSYAEWCMRLEVEDVSRSTESLVLESEGPHPKRRRMTDGSEGAPAPAQAVPAPNQEAADEESVSDTASTGSKSTKTKTKRAKAKTSKPKVPPVTATSSASVAAASVPQSVRPVSPVSSGFHRTYGPIGRKDLRRVEFLRRIPVLQDELAVKVVTSAREGRRFNNVRLRRHGSTVDSTNWQHVYETLSKIYRPDQLVCVSKVGPTDFDAAQCAKWKTFPYRVVTTDPEFWMKASAAERFDERATKDGAEG